jgi:hypothetical protein
MKLSKEFHLPFPMFKKHLMRGSLTIFNLSNHTNPRDVFEQCFLAVLWPFRGQPAPLLG